MNLGQKVTWRNKTCLVTNACIAKGKYIQISPIGNKENPARYFTVFPDEVTKIKKTKSKQI